MNYLHSYHAGNAADVFKHVVLVQLLLALGKKDKPFCYIDTHAGMAHYKLSSAPAQRTREYQQGIGKVWGAAHSSPLFDPYMAIVKTLNPTPKLHYYPGSSWFAEKLLRRPDRMILSEWNIEVYHALKRQLDGVSHAHIHCQEGYQSLKALLPPLERRGLVFIDPPYESDLEFSQIIKTLVSSYPRWDSGIFAVWYPIKIRQQVDYFHHQLLKKMPANTKMLVAELCLLPDDVSHRLNGSGCLIINPPWQLDTQLHAHLPGLLNLLQQDEKGHINVFELK